MKEYILPVRDLVVHPGLTVPVYVDNPMSIACIEEATKNTQRLILCRCLVTTKTIVVALCVVA